jgi:hypothetical protein
MDLKIYDCGLNVASIFGFSKQRGEMESSPEYVLFHGTGEVGIIFGPGPSDLERSVQTEQT